MIKPKPKDRPLKCGATIHRWLGLRWYGWPYPLRWGWFYNQVVAVKYLRPWDKRTAEHVPQTVIFSWTRELYHADAWWKFRRSAFKGCGCIVPLKNAYNKVKRTLKGLR